MSVCPSVCLSMCSLLRYHLNILFSPLPEVGCPKYLEIQNSWGKEMVSDLKTFTNKGCKIAAHLLFFFCEFYLTKPDFFGIGATIHIGWDILCHLYAEFLFWSLDTWRSKNLNKSCLNIFDAFVADPGKARGCSTNSFVIKWFSDGL